VRCACEPNADLTKQSKNVVTLSGGLHYTPWWNGDGMVRGQTAVGAQTLQSDLLAVSGVESAEVDITDGAAPAGVKVRLAPDADARRVGVEVQRVLAAHGMRSRFSDVDDIANESEPASQSPPIPSADTPSSPPPSPITPPPEAPSAPVPIVASVPSPPASAPPMPVSVSAIESVSVEERVDGLSATVVLADGAQATRAVAEVEELDAAVVAAVAEANGQSATPAAIEWLEVDGGSVVTVVLDIGEGSLAAGAGVKRVGRAYAVAIATRLALEA